MTITKQMTTFATIILLSMTITSCGDNASSESKENDKNIIKGSVGKTYQLEDKYQFSVVSYNYYYDTSTEKNYLSVELDYKNIDTNSVILKDVVSGTLTYKDKYNYDMDIYNCETNPCKLKDDGGVFSYKIRDDFSLEPLDSRDFYYNFDIPVDEGIEDGEIISLSVKVQDDNYEYSLEKNEESTTKFERYKKIELKE